MFYRWRPADIDDMDWVDFLAYHSAMERMMAARAGTMTGRPDAEAS